MHLSSVQTPCKPAAAVTGTEQTMDVSGQKCSAAAAEHELHRTKNRIAAVDIARVLAALIVMFEHLGVTKFAGKVGLWTEFLLEESIGFCSAVFFFFAGYFACRNITWKKAFDNAWWSFAPFILWSFIAILAIWSVQPALVITKQSFEASDIISWLGLSSAVTMLREHTNPINAPLWFMRDLVVLFLLSPLLFRWIKWIFPLIVILSCAHGLDPYFAHHPSCAFSPYSFAFFGLGCFIRTLGKETQQKILRFYSPTFIVLFLIVGISCGIIAKLGLCSFISGWRAWPLFPAVMGVWVMYQIARWIEERSSKLTKLCLKIAPVTFLTFASHWPIFVIIRQLPCRDSLWFLLLPFAVFALMSALFFAMKRWCRPLLHLVAHYKLRPDDIR